MSDYDVVKRGSSWGALKEGAARLSGIYSTQSAAEQAAKQFSRNNGGGEVRIHRPNGKIRDSDTMPPAKDPFPPRDTKH